MIYQPSLKKDNGSILIITIWIMVILALFSFGLAHRALIELRLVRFSRDKIKAEYLADAGLVCAQQELAKDANSYDGLNERWSSGFDSDKQEYIFKDVKLKEGSFTISYNLLRDQTHPQIIYGICDEERRLNINRCRDPGLVRQALAILLSSLEVEEPEEIVNTLVDWIDPDTQAFGNALEEPFFKNDIFKAKEELIDVLTSFFYNKRGLNKDEARHNAIEIFLKVRDNITVWGNGQININTASPQVLKAIFSISLANNNVEGATETEIDGLLNKITVYRQGPDAKEFSQDDNYFTRADSGYIIDTLGSYTEPLTTAQRNIMSFMLANQLIAVKSNIFSIESKGTVNSVSRIKKIVVSKSQPPQLLYWHIY
ncbi:MAG: hypothetical protein V1674_02085 [Candidatus Omnitrophota bacterium]